MIAVSLSDVTKYYGARPVLEGVSWEIHEGETVGLVGPNGAGKSTLFKLIAGEESPDGGTISRRRDTSVGYLPQEPELDPEKTVIEEVLDADQALGRLEREMSRLEARMGEPAVYEDATKLEQVMESHATALAQFERRGGLNFRGRAESTLRDLGLGNEEFELSTTALSGGQRKLVGLARVLVAQPDVLLLDEPDNHLDLAGKARLEQVIARHAGTVVIISHDRYLLDILAESIVEVELNGQHPGRPQLAVFAGNYSEFATAKQSALLKQQKDHLLDEREAKRLQQSILRLKAFSSGGQNEKLVRRWKSMQKRLDKMERTPRPVLERRRMGLELDSERGSKKVLEVTSLHKSFDGVELFSGLELLISSGERVGLLGPNGSGKSVLFRTILGDEPPTAGRTRLGPSISVGYYSQEHETLDVDRTPLEEVRRLRTMSEGEGYSFLGRFLFDYEAARKQIGTMSGGEKSRLQMAKLMLARANLLLLDEPTNNLDIPSSEVLEEALEDYEGTVLVISHDRYFLERIVHRIVELDGGRLAEYPGGYAYYREKKLSAEAQATART